MKENKGADQTAWMYTSQWKLPFDLKSMKHNLMKTPSFQRINIIDLKQSDLLL